MYRHSFPVLVRPAVWGCFFWIASAALGPVAGWTQQPPPSPDLREQSIYIPYSKLKETFEKEGRGVWLPYEKFQQLWKAATAPKERAAEPRPPVGVMIKEIHNEASVEGNVLRVAAQAQVEVLGKGWHEAPLRLADAAIRSARLGDQPARLVFRTGKGYFLLVENKTDQPAALSLHLEYVKAVETAPGRNRVSFQAPQAPINRWTIRVPRSDVDITVHPMIAATQESAPTKIQGPQPPAPEPREKKDASSVLLALVGPAPQVRVEWTGQVEGASGLTAVASVETQQQVRIEEGVVRTRAELNYSIRRAALDKLRLAIPSNQRVVGVFDPNVRQWEFEKPQQAPAGEKKNDPQVLVAHLFDPAQGDQKLILELEQFYQLDKVKPAGTVVEIPAIQALDASRQQGVVSVSVAPQLRAETVDHQSLSPVDPQQRRSLPPRGRGRSPQTGSVEMAYRFSGASFRLRLNVEKASPQIQADQLVEIYFQPQQLTVDWLGIVEIERAGVYRFELDIPAGFEVRQARGAAVAGAQAAMVESHELADAEGDNPAVRRLTLQLSRQAIGRVGVFVELTKKLSDPNLLSPTGNSSSQVLAAPQARGEHLLRASGRLLAYKSESLRLRPTNLTGLQSISTAEAFTSAPSQRGGRFADTAPAVAFTFATGAASLSADLQRRRPYVTAAQVLAVDMQTGVVEFTTTLKYKILYSGVSSLRVDVPDEIVPQLRKSGGNLNFARRQAGLPAGPQNASQPPPEGYATLELTGDGELLGDHAITLRWRKKMDSLKVGQAAQIEIPRLAPAEVDRASGQIVIAKADMLDMQPAGQPQGVRPIDRGEVTNAPLEKSVAGAFEFDDQWTLALSVTRYALERLKRTSIERAVLRMAATRSDQITVQALYRIRSTRQRLAFQLPDGLKPEEAFDAQPLRINGTATPPERGENGWLYAPLAGLQPDKPFLLEIRYTAPATSLRLLAPEFPEDPAVQHVYLCAYVPDDRAVIAADGPWSNETAWGWNSAWMAAPRQELSDASLIRQLLRGVSAPNPLENFQHDGRRYLFFSLRPPSDADSGLTLRTVDVTLLNVVMFGVVAILGLALMLTGATTRLAVVGLLLALCVGLGVFWPLLSLHAINGVFAAAVGLVGAAWVLQLAGRTMTRRPRQSASGETADRQETGQQNTAQQTASAESSSSGNDQPLIIGDISDSQAPSEGGTSDEN